MNDQILVHHGIKSQKWGNRRYQYEDGSLTPLGRIHYGVGEARDRAKIAMKQEKAKAKNEARIVKARAKAEADKIKAEANAYKIKKRADDEVEKEKIKAEREKEKDIAKENRKLAEEDIRQEKQLENLAKEAKDETKSRTLLKIALGATAAVGIGYILYKSVGQGGSIEGTESAANKGKEIVSKLSNKNTSEIASNFNNKKDAANAAKELSRQKALISKTIKAERKAAEAFNKKDALATAKEITRQKELINIGKWDDWIEKLKGVASMKHGDILVVKPKDDKILCHHGIKGQKWGVRRWQYENGTLTPEGREHYGVLGERHSSAKNKHWDKYYNKYTEKEYNRLNKQMSNAQMVKEYSQYLNNPEGYINRKYAERDKDPDSFRKKYKEY